MKNTASNDPQNQEPSPEPRRYEARFVVAYRIYDSPRENLEQAVALYHAAQNEPEKIQRDGMWKAAIVFSMMAIEAQIIDAVASRLRDATLCQHCAKRIRKEIQKSDPASKKLPDWVATLTSTVIEKEQEPYKTYLELVDYRNATVHSGKENDSPELREKAHLLRSKWTTAEGARKALLNAQAMFELIHHAFELQRPDLLAWAAAIIAKASETRGNSP